MNIYFKFFARMNMPQMNFLICVSFCVYDSLWMIYTENKIDGSKGRHISLSLCCQILLQMGLQPH